MKKRDLENFNFIKSKFDEAMPEIPLILDERMIERKIISKEERKVIKMKTNRRKNFRVFASAAACLLLFIKEMICLLLLILLLRLKHLKIMMS